jgi:Lon protease-like protein
VERLGLFPLGLVLMPSERIPLHIFEPRYRQLIGECLERDDEFGIVLTRPDGDIHRIGTRTAVIDVLERMPDGRLNILVEGRERFSVVEVEHTDSYAIATVEPFADRDDPPPADVLARLEAAYRQLQQAEGPEPADPVAATAPLDFAIAARAGLDAAEKQQLLELRSPRERADRLTAMLEHALEARAYEIEAHHRASGNGRVIPPG